MYDADSYDKAAELQEALNQKGIAQVRDALLPESHPDFDGTHCVDCSADIPAKRLALSRVRCIDCQTTLEQRSKLFK